MELEEQAQWESRAKWDDKFIQQATQLTFLGLSEQQIADVWGIALVTLHKWKNNKPGFYEALQRGRIPYLAEVADAMHRAAVGYYYTEQTAVNYKGEVKIVDIQRYAKPNPWAAAKILALKDPTWREVQKTESVHTNINIAKLDLSSMSTEQIALLESIQKKQLTDNVGNS
jgi:hypothetical protein